MADYGYFELYKGYEDFEALVKEGKIKLGTSIRVRDYGRLIGPIMCLLEKD